MSAYVLARLLPAPARRFQELTAACTDSRETRFALAGLNAWLASLGGGELQEAVASPPPRLTPFLASCIAAMAEFACAKNGVAPPSWVRATPPLAEPAFGSELMSLRLYRLTHFLVGGAVMCLAYAARPSTQDVDGLFRPARQVCEAAARVALQAGVSPDWLYDGVKGFLSEHGEFSLFLGLDHLRVMVAQPEYLLAMKCLALRIGAESRDEDDIRHLLRHLAIGSYERAVAVITRFYPPDRFPQKTLYALGELLPKRD